MSSNPADPTAALSSTGLRQLLTRARPLLEVGAAIGIACLVGAVFHGFGVESLEKWQSEQHWTRNFGPLLGLLMSAGAALVIVVAGTLFFLREKRMPGGRRRRIWLASWLIAAAAPIGYWVGLGPAAP